MVAGAFFEGSVWALRLPTFSGDGQRTYLSYTHAPPPELHRKPIFRLVRLYDVACRGGCRSPRHGCHVRRAGRPLHLR